MANINKNHIMQIDVGNATLRGGDFSFYITDKNTSNLFVELAINTSNNPLIGKFVAIEQASDYMVTLVMIKPDKEILYIDGELLEEEKLFYFDFSKEVLNQIGKFKCEFRVKCVVNGVEEVRTTAPFKFDVLSSIVNNLDKETEKVEVFPIYERLLEKLNNIEERLLVEYATKKYVDEAIESINEVTTAMWVYKDTDVSKLSTDTAITETYIELTNDNYTTRIDEVLQWYPNCTDLYLFDDGSVTTLEYMLDTNNETYKSQITNVAFLDGYFDNLTSMYSTFNNCTALIQAPAIPQGVTNMSYTFYECTSLTQAPDIPSSVTSMSYMFQGCTALTTAPNISSNGGAIVMDSAFQGCTALTTAPAIPQGVVTLYQTFHSCTSLTTVPAIPDSVIRMYNTFRGCTSLTTAPTIPSSVTDMKYAFAYCENLTSVNIPSSVKEMDYTFRSCSKLQNITIDSTLDDLKKITQLYRDCSIIETVYIPLKSVTGSFSDVLTGTDALKDVVWLGERNSSFNVTLLKGNIPQTDIQELVSEHLADLTALGTTATLTLGETYLAYLTEDEIAQAVAKGWTIQ